MRRDLPSFTSIRSFEAAARHLSFRCAAKELHVTQSAISHQVKALEDHLGVQLFLRGTRKIALTDEGADYLDQLSLVLDQLAAVTDRVREKDVSGPLFVRTTPAFAARWLVPRLNSFHETYPRIELHISTSLEPADFCRRSRRYQHPLWATRVSGIAHRSVPFILSFSRRQSGSTR